MSTIEEQRETTRNAQPEETELSENDLEDAAGGRTIVFEDKNGNGIPDIIEPSPTNPGPILEWHSD